jgi:signal transduction histidine kinase
VTAGLGVQVRAAPSAVLERAATAMLDAVGGRELVLSSDGRSVLRVTAAPARTAVAGPDEAAVTVTRGLTFGGRLVGMVRVTFDGAPPAPSTEWHFRILVRHLAVGLARHLRRDEVIIERASARMTSLVDGTYEADGLRQLTSRLREVAGALLGTTGAAISVWDAERNLLKVLPGAFGTSGRSLSEMGGPATDLRSNAARVFRTQLPYLSNSAVGDPCILQSYVERHGLRRVVSVPLVVGDRCIGVLHLANPPRDLTLRDLRRCELLAPWVATAVELARAVAAERTRRHLDAMVSAAAVAVASGTTVHNALTPAFQSIADVMCASVMAIVPVDGEPLVWERASVPPLLRAQFFESARAGRDLASCGYPHDAADLGWADFHTQVRLGDGRLATFSMLREHGVPVSPNEADALHRLGGIVALAWAADRDRRLRTELTRLRERQSIADDLHDRVAQILFAAQIGIDSLLEAETSAGEHSSRLREVRSLLTKGDTVIRDVINRLSPVRRQPPSARLRDILSDIDEEFGMTAELKVDPTAERALDGSGAVVAECALKVAREATVNAVKHARPGHVRLGLRVAAEADALEITVADDGIGLPDPDGEASRLSFGMASMARAVENARGELLFGAPRSGSGTTVTALLPLPETAGQDSAHAAGPHQRVTLK